MKRLIFISSLVFALLLMYACNEEQGVNKTINKNVGNVGNPQNGNNPSNPYDWVGVQHNAAMNDFVQVKDSLIVYNGLEINYDLTINNIENWDIDFFNTNYGYNFNINDFDSLYGLTIKEIAFNPDSSLVVLNNNAAFSQDFIDFLNYYKNKMELLSTIDSMITFTESMEDSVSQINYFTDNEKNCMFSILSVGKHSSEFWGNYFNIQKNDKSKGVKIQLTKRQVGKIIASDFVGAYFGFLRGAFLGAGTPTAMAAGAAIGAAYASAVTAIREI